MAVGTFVWLFFRKKIGIKARRLMMIYQNQSQLNGMVRLIKQIVMVLLAIELISFIILGTYFLNYYSSAGEAYLNGFFGTISAISNGGFDITGQSLIPFKDDYFVFSINIVFIVFVVIGCLVVLVIELYSFLLCSNR